MMNVKPHLVLVGGVSASGKSTFAKKIREKFGNEKVCIVSMDSYYRPLGKMTKEEFSKVNLDTPEAINWDLLNEHVDVLLNGSEVSVPIIDFETCSIKGSSRVKPSEIIVLEGLWVLSDKSLGSKADVKVYLEIDDPTQLSRRIERDTTERNFKKEEILVTYSTHVKPMQERFVRPTRVKADLTLRQDNFDYGIDKVAERLSYPKKPPR